MMRLNAPSRPYLVTTVALFANLAMSQPPPGPPPPPPRPPRPGGLARCRNTCYRSNNFPSNSPYASDGDCDDGGPGSEFSICPIGTDCIDCGPRAISLLTPPPPSPSPPPPRPPRPPTGPGGNYTQCLNSCPYANDRDCDDGGPGSEYINFCYLGTDCDDCGPRTLSTTIPPPPSPSPPPPYTWARSPPSPSPPPPTLTSLSATLTAGRRSPPPPPIGSVMLLWLVALSGLAIVLILVLTLLCLLRRSSSQVRIDPTSRGQRAHQSVEMASMAQSNIAIGTLVSGSGSSQVAPHPPTATVATVVAQPVLAQPARLTHQPSRSIEEMQLAEMVDLLTNHLGVHGNMAEVIQQSAQTLGIERSSGMSLPELARKCVEALGLLMPGAAPPTRAPGA